MLRAARPAGGVEGGREAARWAREAGGQRTRARGGGGRRRAAYVGEGDDVRRRGRGRRRAASRARATAAVLIRRRREGVRALVFIAPPLVAVGEATRD